MNYKIEIAKIVSESNVRVAICPPLLLCLAYDGPQKLKGKA